MKMKMKLNREARIARALGSQSKSSLIYHALEEEELSLLAECCDEAGVISRDTPEIVGDVMAAYYERNKATVEEDAENNEGIDAPQDESE